MSFNSLSDNQKKFKNITNNILFCKSQSFFKEDKEFSATVPINGLVFYYNHKGNSKCNYQTSSLKTLHKESQLSTLILNNDEVDVSISKGVINASSITLEKEFLLKNFPDGKIKEKIIENLEINKPCKLLGEKNINPQVQLLLNNIYNNPFSNQLDELYAQSKILELISFELQNLINIEPYKNNKVKLDEDDIQAIKKAKELLLANMQNPPSIIELSRQVRINEFKLKYGFKKVFNDTPYNILLHYKLEYAKELLIHNEINIGEVAKLVGYKSLSSFTKAFTKKHGLRPIDLMKTRKYYY